MKDAREFSLVFLILAGVVGCSAHRVSPGVQTAKCDPQRVVQMAETEAVMFPAGMGWVDGYAHGEITSFWTPTLSDASAVEAPLRAHLRQFAPQLEPRLSEYRRQYTGFFHRDKRLLFVNLFCNCPPSLEWRCQPVQVDDGGDCFFQLECDPSTLVCDKLWINGDA